MQTRRGTEMTVRRRNMTLAEPLFRQAVGNMVLPDLSTCDRRHDAEMATVWRMVVQPSGVMYSGVSPNNRCPCQLIESLQEPEPSRWSTKRSPQNK
jgi:hypothetical protein